MTTTAVTVVTGFLGSGKTTLIARLLRDPRLVNTAVIVNEFGEVGLDHALVESVQGEVVLLAQGCLCCTLNGDLANTLEGLDTKRTNGAVPDFDRVIVETTGLADPAPVLQTILDRAALLRGYRLGAVLTTVDAVTGNYTLDHHVEALRQVAIADHLLLTKTDLSDFEQVETLSRRLALLNPRALIQPVIQGSVDPEIIFTGDEHTAPFGGLVIRLDGLADASSQTNGHAHRVATMALQFAEPLPYATLRDWLAQLVTDHGRHLLRVKGIVAIRGQDRPIAVHGVQHQFHPPQFLAAWPPNLTQSTLVFILDGLDPAVITASVASAGLLSSLAPTSTRERKETGHDHRPHPH